MAYIVANLVFNESEDGPYRRTFVYEQDREQDQMAIMPEENQIIIWGVSRVLVKVKEKDGISKVLMFVESIYADGFKVFDYNDFDIKTYMINGEKKYKLEDRRPIKIPVIL